MTLILVCTAPVFDVLPVAELCEMVTPVTSVAYDVLVFDDSNAARKGSCPQCGVRSTSCLISKCAITFEEASIEADACIHILVVERWAELV